MEAPNELMEVLDELFEEPELLEEPDEGEDLEEFEEEELFEHFNKLFS